MKRLIALAILTIVAVPLTADPLGNEDYPLDALSRHEQGIVLVDLTVGTDGRAKDCKVLVSPGSRTLAEATCRNFVTRARFIAARDGHGNPEESHVRAKITWVIPGCAAPRQDHPYLHDPVIVAGTITSLQRC